MKVEYRTYRIYISGSEHTPDLKEWQSVLRDYCDYISLFESKLRGCDYNYELNTLWGIKGELVGVINIKTVKGGFVTGAEELADLINYHSCNSDITMYFEESGTI